MRFILKYLRNQKIKALIEKISNLTNEEQYYYQNKVKVKASERVLLKCIYI